MSKARPTAMTALFGTVRSLAQSKAIDKHKAEAGIRAFGKAYDFLKTEVSEGIYMTEKLQMTGLEMTEAAVRLADRLTDLTTAIRSRATGSDYWVTSDEIAFLEGVSDALRAFRDGVE